MDFLNTAFNWLTDILYAIALITIGWLPDSPFQNEQYASGLSSFKTIMGNINYFVPIGQMLTITTVYVVAVAVWYVARWILRIVKYID